jgi:hypothetical protein
MGHFVDRNLTIEDAIKNIIVQPSAVREGERDKPEPDSRE